MMSLNEITLADFEPSLVEVQMWAPIPVPDNCFRIPIHVEPTLIVLNRDLVTSKSLICCLLH
jgi:hypothetical protein